MAGEPVGLERLQKVLAHAGIDSRRSCEELILQGRVTVNGKVVRELGTRVDANRSTIAVDGQTIHQERPVYFAVNKPKGYVSTNQDPSGRPRVVDLLPEIPQRVYTVGRLDEMSTGLMLLTNDGELANKLAHPRFGVEKLYRAVVAGVPSQEVLKQLTDGIWLAEGKVRAKQVRAVGRRGESTVLDMVLAEGKNREVRRMLAKLGHKVMTLTRVAVGPISLKGLAPGAYRSLSKFEVDQLRKVAAGLLVPSTSRAPRRKSSRPSSVQATARHETDGGPRRRGPARASSAAQGHGKPARPRPGSPSPGGPRRPQSARRPTGPQGGRPPRPEGVPPSQRPAPPSRPKSVSTPREQPPTRRIIGLPSEPERAGPSGASPRRPKPKGRFPRAALGRRRPKPGDEAAE